MGRAMAELELEACDVARAMCDPEAKRRLLFVSESYGHLAGRAELRMARLFALAERRDATSKLDKPGESTDYDDQASSLGARRRFSFHRENLGQLQLRSPETEQ